MPNAKERESLRERLKAYMLKAVREAKVRTSWINPDAEYEAALERFVTESLANPLFLKDLADVVPRFAHLGLLVSLSQALVKVASPGVPDYYQGTELLDFSLVDPDNRRPVDFAARDRLLAELDRLGDGAAEAAWERRDEGLPKLLAVSHSRQHLREMFDQQWVQVAILPRFQFPAPVAGRPKSAHEWFDKYFQVATSAAALPSKEPVAR